MEDYVVPDFRQQVDLAAHLQALPPTAACKGLFFLDPIERIRKVAPEVDIAAAAGIPARRYVPFLNYPYSEFLTLLVHTAKMIHPDVPTGEGLRRLGRNGYEALLGSQVGKVIFGVFGRNFEYVVMYGGRGYSVSVNFGRVDVEKVGRGHVRYHFFEMPALLATYQLGIVEGGMKVCGVTGEIRTRMRDISNGSLDIRWHEADEI